MHLIPKRRPSPATVVSIAALIVALAGTAVAEMAARSNALDNKEKTAVKKIARKQSNKQITKRAPNLTVGAATNAQQAESAANADNAAKLGGLDPGAFQQEARWAIADKTGNIVSQSGGITATRIAGGTYILDFGSSLTGKSIQATRFITSTDSGGSGTVVVGVCGGGGAGIDCSGLAPTMNDENHLFVAPLNASNTANEDHSFTVTVLP